MRIVPIVLFLAAFTAVAQETPSPAPPAPVTDSTVEEFEKAGFFGKKFFDLKEYGSAFDQFAKAEELYGGPGRRWSGAAAPRSPEPPNC